jgi:hypothetical protein
MPTGVSATVSGGAVTAVTSSTTGSGCSGTISVQVVEVQNLVYGIDLAAASDSDFQNASVVGTGTKAAFHVSGGNNTYGHLHPTNTPTGLYVDANSPTYISGTECDTLFTRCFDFEDAAGVSVVGTTAYTSAWNPGGYNTFYFGASAGHIEIGSQGGLCTVGSVPTNYQEFVGPSGVINWPGFGLTTFPGNNIDVLGNDSACASYGNVSSQQLGVTTLEASVAKFGTFQGTQFNSSAILSNYNGQTTQDAGMEYVWTEISCTQATPCASSTTNLRSSPSGNTTQYRYDITIYCTSAVAGATVAVNMVYTDPSSTLQTETSPAAVCTTLGAASKVQFSNPFASPPGFGIQYSVTTANSPSYQLRIDVFRETTN